MLKNVSPGLIENVKDLKIALNELTVYDLNVYSSIEIYYKIAHKLNEVINELSRFEGVLSDEVINPLEMDACLPGCVWNATPRSLSPLERNIGFWTQA